MALRRSVSLVILATFLAITVFAFLGNPLLATVFVVIEAAVLGHHALRLCGRCSNTACGFHPERSAEDGESAAATSECDFSDLPVNRTTVLPLLLSYPFAVIAAWQFSPLATIGAGAVAISAHSVFRRITCAHCGNDCVGNCNPAYKAWKAARAHGEP